MINNLHDLALALGMREVSGETLTNRAAGWLYAQGVSATSGADGLSLYPLGSLERTLVPWPVTLDRLKEIISELVG